MARDTAQRRDVLTTKVTIIQLQAELLRRQLRYRDGLSEADRRWLETALATIVQATREIIPLIVDEPDVRPEQWVRGVPTQHLTVFDLPARSN
jgi:hypothetical protein